MTLTAARQVADAVLYEGYLLYPYRASSAKNQVRWQFGVLGPIGAAEAGAGEPTAMSTQVVLESDPDATINILLRFLHVQSRVVQRATALGWEPALELFVAGTRWIPFHEAVPREIPLHNLQVPDLFPGIQLDVTVPGGQDIEDLHEEGRLVGRLIRTRSTLHAVVGVSMRPGLAPQASILAIQVENVTGWSLGDTPPRSVRDVAAMSSLVGTHLMITRRGTRFISLLDGPDWALPDTSSCDQHRCWPVMIADDNGDDAVLVSPIVLGDYPTIAPESAGDLFDATEIDEILTLRVMTMTDQEKSDARGTDPRAAAILARCDAMTDGDMVRLHGARRAAEPPNGSPDLPAPSGQDVSGEHMDIPWWDAAHDARAQPERDAVLVGGRPVSKGSRVLLRPSRRADAQDLFLAGLTAVVARVYFDVDGDTHIAVILEDDPAAELYGTTGRFYYFGPEEVEPLPAREDAR